MPFYEYRFSEFFYALRERDAVGGGLVHQGRGKALSRISHQENDSTSVLVAHATPSFVFKYVFRPWALLTVCMA